MALDSKTFKNPGVMSDMSYHIVANYFGDGASYVFDRKHYDMEVKFVRKPPPFEPGYYMRHSDLVPHPNAVWFEKKPTGSLENFWTLWKPVEVADVELED